MRSSAVRLWFVLQPEPTKEVTEQVRSLRESNRVEAARMNRKSTDDRRRAAREALLDLRHKDPEATESLNPDDFMRCVESSAASGAANANAASAQSWRREHRRCATPGMSETAAAERLGGVDRYERLKRLADARDLDMSRPRDCARAGALLFEGTPEHCRDGAHVR